MSSQGLIKNGKKLIVVANITIPAMIIVGVMLAGTAHPPKNTTSNAIQQLAGAGDAPSAASAPRVPVMAPPSLIEIERATPSPWIRAHQDKDCVEAGGVTLICFIHSTLIGKEAK